MRYEHVFEHYYVMHILYTYIYQFMALISGTLM